MHLCVRIFAYFVCLMYVCNLFVCLLCVNICVRSFCVQSLCAYFYQCEDLLCVFVGCTFDGLAYFVFVCVCVCGWVLHLEWFGLLFEFINFHAYIMFIHLWFCVWLEWILA